MRWGQLAVGRRAGPWRLLGAFGGALIVAGVIVVLLTRSGDARMGAPNQTGRLSARPPQGGPSAIADGADPVSPNVALAVTDTPVGQTIAPGFLGLSFEFQAVRVYTGPDAGQINPVLVQLIRNLAPSQRPVLRIGGDSTDLSYVAAPGVRPPPYVGYRLTPGWLATTATLAHELDARMIMGLNLAANQPVLSAAEAQQFLARFGSHYVAALEIGNEPNVYGKLTVYHTLLGIPFKARPRGFGYPAFRREFQAIAAASPHLTLAGPALATGPTPMKGSWVKTLPDFLRRDPRVAIMTVHRYPLRNCYVPPSSPQYPTVAHLLSNYSTVFLARSVRRWIRIAHTQHRQLRVDELNSVACRGKAGISDTFASSLWGVDALFALARAGVDGVNIHTLPGSAYELFQFSHSGGRWRGSVRPLYYGLQLFAQAAPPGSRLLRLDGAAPGGGLSEWATLAPDHTVRVVLINKDPSRARTVTLRPPGAAFQTARVERLQAPSVWAKDGIRLGGRTYTRETETGRLRPPLTQPITEHRGAFTVAVPAGSAALVSLER